MVTSASGRAALISASISAGCIAIGHASPIKAGRVASCASRSASHGYGPAAGQNQVLARRCGRCASPARRPPRAAASSAAASAPPGRSGPGPRRTSRHGRAVPAGRAAGWRRCRRPWPSRPPPPAARHRRRRGRRATAPARIWARTKSPLRRSAARSTGGGAPSSRPAISRSQSDWPSQPRVSPTSTRSSAGGRARPTAWAASSSTPTPPIAGVGRMPRPSVSL